MNGEIEEKIQTYQMCVDFCCCSVALLVACFQEKCFDILPLI